MSNLILLHLIIQISPVSFVLKDYSGAGKMAPSVKTLAVKADDLSLTLGAHMVERIELRKFSFHLHTMENIHTQEER